MDLETVALAEDRVCLRLRNNPLDGSRQRGNLELHPTYFGVVQFARFPSEEGEINFDLIGGLT